MTLSERLTSLEATVQAAGWGIGLAAGFLAAALAVGATFIIFDLEDTKEQIVQSEQRLDSKIDGVETKIDRLPDRLLDITDAISNSITATKQQPIIIMPPQQDQGSPGER